MAKKAPTYKKGREEKMTWDRTAITIMTHTRISNASDLMRAMPTVRCCKNSNNFGCAIRTRVSESCNMQSKYHNRMVRRKMCIDDGECEMGKEEGRREVVESIAIYAASMIKCRSMYHLHTSDNVTMACLLSPDTSTFLHL